MISPPYGVVCEGCGRNFLPSRPDKFHCDATCRWRAKRKRDTVRREREEAAMACTKDQYHLTLQENLRRMNTSRDEAVRMTNEEHGYGSSTALQHDVPDTVVDAPTQHGGDAA